MTFAAVAGAGLIISVTAATALWMFSLRRRDSSIIDIWWGPGFALLTWTYCLLLSAFRPRSLVVAVLVTMWGARLGIHIGRRHRGEDPRYQAMRAARGPAFWWKSLFVVFWLQATILWFVALPLLAAVRATAPAWPAAADVAGLLIFAAGFLCEAVGDRQLERFRASAANRGHVLDSGLWRYTRHPNYFGDATLWWGLFLIAAATPGGWMTAASPALMTLLLLRVSGVALLERNLAASKPSYADYIARTSAFVPWFPRRRV